MEIFLDFEHKPLQFINPASIISCYEPSCLADAFAEIEQALGKGFYVAGFISYEAGYCFEERLRQEKKYDFPLILMGVYERPIKRRLETKKSGKFSVYDFRLNVSKAEYSSHIDTIRDHIEQGNVYQITYCIKFHFRFRGDPIALYSELFRRQPVPYPAYIRTEKFQILSLSPERFIKKESGHVTTEPMKGTWQRGRTFLGDISARLSLWRDEKNRAENLMICDLLRNDLGRVGGLVRVPKLFTVAQYRTLFQMTSTVTAQVPRGMLMYDLFAAIFPSGSVTGCPKIRAMGIIRGLEREDRKIYTGAIGYIAPDRNLYFNIPIRTVLIQDEKAEMGVGGGIVWDSTAQGEWDEGLLKASFLTSLSATPATRNSFRSNRETVSASDRKLFLL